LANYLSGERRPLSLEELVRSTRGEHSQPIWTELTGLPASARSLELDWSYRRRYFEALRRTLGDGPLLVKSHTINGALSGEAAFDFQDGDHVIHVVRHPCDVAISCADFYGISLETSVERMLTPGHLIDGRPDNGFEVMGSWEQHTRSWLAACSVPVVRLRYFEMVEHPAAALTRLVEFLGLERDEARIRAAASYAAFEVLRAQEEVNGFAECSPTAASGRFFRVGRPRQWLDSASPALAARLIHPNEDLIREIEFGRSTDRV
jgi:hypothetical protein